MKRRSREVIWGLCQKAQDEIDTGKPTIATLEKYKLNTEQFYTWRKRSKLAKPQSNPAPKYARLTAEPSFAAPTPPSRLMVLIGSPAEIRAALAAGIGQ